MIWTILCGFGLIAVSFLLGAMSTRTAVKEHAIRRVEAVAKVHGDAMALVEPSQRAAWAFAVDVLGRVANDLRTNL